MDKVAATLKSRLKQRNITKIIKIMKNIRALLKRIKNGIENLTATTFLHKVSINTQGIKESVLKRLKLKIKK